MSLNHLLSNDGQSWKSFNCNNLNIGGNLFQNVEALDSSGATIMTASDVLGGVAFINSTGGALQLTLPTAASLATAAGSQLGVGSAIKLLVVNKGGNNITVSAGADSAHYTLNITNSTVILANTSRLLYFVLTASTPAFTVYG